MSRISTRDLSIMALLAALVGVATMVIQIPVAATNGFINFGDAVIFLISIIFGPVFALIAGGIGSAMADILTGYGHWAPFTFVIKGLEGLLCGYIYLLVMKTTGKTVFAYLSSMAIAGLWMIVGYFFAGAFLYGYAATVASILGNVVQAVGSLTVAIFMVHPIRKALKR
ncbi:MAG: ECF transporter S component [bacterium]|nr:ECF transporter S component [bacterium]